LEQLGGTRSCLSFVPSSYLDSSAGLGEVGVIEAGVGRKLNRREREGRAEREERREEKMIRGRLKR